MSYVVVDWSLKRPARSTELRYTGIGEGPPTHRRSARSTCLRRDGDVPASSPCDSRRGVMDTPQSVPVAHVLIANPVVNLREGFRHVARLLGCSVTEASTREEVLAQLAKTPDIAVVDA